MSFLGLNIRYKFWFPCFYFLYWPKYWANPPLRNLQHLRQVSPHTPGTPSILGYFFTSVSSTYSDEVVSLLGSTDHNLPCHFWSVGEHEAVVLSPTVEWLLLPWQRPICHTYGIMGVIISGKEVYILKLVSPYSPREAGHTACHTLPSRETYTFCISSWNRVTSIQWLDNSSFINTKCYFFLPALTLCVAYDVSWKMHSIFPS